MNAETQAILDKAERSRLMTNARARKSYEKNREKKVAYERERRAAAKEQVGAARATHAARIVEAAPPPAPAPAPAYDELRVDSRGKALGYNKEQCIALVNASDASVSTKNSYKSSIRRYFKLQNNCDTLSSCLGPRTYKATLEKIDNSPEHKVDAKRATYQVLAKLLDPKGYNAAPGFSKSHTSTLFKYVVRKYRIYSAMVDKKQKEKKDTMVVPPFSEYLDRVLEQFGEKSKEYLVAYLYSIVTLRDNFKNMKIIKLARENVGTANYVRFSPTGGTTFYINSYKTRGSYGAYERKLDLKNPAEAKLHRLLAAYLYTNELTYGDLLFNKSSLSPFVTKIHRSVGFDYPNAAINLYRNMKVSDTFAGADLTEAQIHDFAEEMQHSIDVHFQYQRPTKSVVHL